MQNSIMTSLRKDWFDHVKKTRKKMSKGQKVLVEHREAMKNASVSWPKEKERILKKRKREEKRDAKKSVREKNISANKNAEQKTQ